MLAVRIELFIAVTTCRSSQRSRHMDQEFTTEAQCPVCSQWPPADRAGKRELFVEIPLHDPVCKRCFVAFWSNISGHHFTEEDLDEALRLEAEGKGATIELRRRRN
jgi:hypothetical protein